MKHSLLVLIAVVSLAALSGCRDDSRPLPSSPDLATASVARVGDYDVQVLEVAIPGARSPQAQGSNDQGDIVGYYYAAPEYRLHGFLRSGGTFQTLDYPGAVSTTATGVNNRGDVVGRWSDGSRFRGFLLRDGAYTAIDRPDAVLVVPEDINERGDIAGVWRSADSPTLIHGFIIRNGVFTSFDLPGTSITRVYGMSAEGDIVGFYAATDAEGNALDLPFIRRMDGTFLTDFEAPGENVIWWGFSDINARGDVVGWYYPPGGPGCVSFVRDKNGQYTLLTTPAATQTDGFSIDESGVVVGATYTPTGSFIAVPRHQPAD